MFLNFTLLGNSTEVVSHLWHDQLYIDRRIVKQNIWVLCQKLLAIKQIYLSIYQSIYRSIH